MHVIIGHYSKHITLHKLRRKLSASATTAPVSQTLRKEYEDEHFQRIEYSENHALLYAADGAFTSLAGIFSVTHGNSLHTKSLVFWYLLAKLSGCFSHRVEELLSVRSQFPLQAKFLWLELACLDR
jgi:hypothetical protein